MHEVWSSCRKAVVPSRGDILACGLLVVVSVATLWQSLVYLFASPYPYGVDGYYYLGEILLPWTTHSFRDGVVTVWFIKFLALFVAPVAAIKISGALFLFASSWLALVVVYRLCGSLWPAVLAYVLVLKGFLHVELLIDFLKQSFGHVWLWVLLLAVVGVLERRTWWAMAGIVVSLVGAALSHRFCGVLGIAIMGSLVLVIAARWLAPRHGFSLAFGILIAAPLAASAFATRAGRLLTGDMRYFLEFSFSPCPRLNLASAYDSFGPAHPGIPIAAVMTVLLIAALFSCLIECIRLDRHARRGGGGDARSATSCTVGMTLLPLVALCFSPFVVPASENTLALHLRLIVALSIPAAVLAPCALERLPGRTAVKQTIVAGLALFFGLTPSFWQGFSGPPSDGGMLHEAMERTRELVPSDVTVIVPDIMTGNMVRALWNRRYTLDGRRVQATTRTDYYRFVMLGKKDVEALRTCIGEEHGPLPIVVLGPWTLLDEKLYQASREYLNEDTDRDRESSISVEIPFLNGES